MASIPTQLRGTGVGDLSLHTQLRGVFLVSKVWWEEVGVNMQLCRSVSHAAFIPKQRRARFREEVVSNRKSVRVKEI